jgi:3-oxocholest-4-en-26-oate---CoA ligase
VYESYATWWEAVTDAVPDAVALVQGERRLTYREWDDRAARLASALASFGIGAGAKVALHLYNCPEYLEACAAAFKLRAVPVNVNFRYRASELGYLLDNADAEVVITHTSLTGALSEALPELDRLRAVVVVADEGEHALAGAYAYEDLVAAAEPAPRITRSGDDFLFWYTGGTTGLPKGVMWHQGTLLDYAVTRGYVSQGLEPPASLAEAGPAAATLRARGTAQVQMPTTPLIHATAMINAFQGFSQSGRVVLLESRRFDAHELWRTVERERVTNLTIVGDPIARRMVEALDEADARGTPYDVSSVRRILSSGAVWSAPVKAALRARGDMVLYDTLGASEGIGFAVSEAGPADDVATGQSTSGHFHLGAGSALVGEDGRRIPPGSGEPGMLATSGIIAVGYYKDPERTARVFREIDGQPFVVPGDWATVDADGSVTFLGRGSGCITTGGEKVWPEEVEETLKEHPAVADALVVGADDDEWGQVVVAVVAPTPNAVLDVDELHAWSVERLAGYKAPRRIVVVDEVPRGPAGKADYRAARALTDS